MKSHLFHALAAAVVLTAPVACKGQVQITGSGATFPYPIYRKWADEYHKARPEAQINYQSIGSGGGIRQIIDGTVDFGATDGPMTDEQIAEFKMKRKMDVLHFPTVLGAVVPIYNVPGVSTGLKFTPEVLAGVFLGTITKWNDPALAKANPGVKLPASDILIVHRSDGSGTTYVWTDYLSKVSGAWKAKAGVGTSVNWPVGLGAPKNDGVAALVRQTAGSLGYVELIYAHQNNIAFGSVQNAAGEFVTASLASVNAAAAGSASTMPADFRVSITNAPGKTAYPIASFTWLLIPTQIQDAAKKRVITDFLKWMLNEGQGFAEGLQFAKLPPSVVAKELAMIARVK